MEARDEMVGVAGLPKAIFGTELDPLSKEQKKHFKKKSVMGQMGKQNLAQKCSGDYEPVGERAPQ